MVYKNNLKPWLRNRPYLWRITGCLCLIFLVPLCAVVSLPEFWHEFRWVLKDNAKDSIDLAMGRVKE